MPDSSHTVSFDIELIKGKKGELMDKGKINNKMMNYEESLRTDFSIPDCSDECLKIGLKPNDDQQIQLYANRGALKTKIGSIEPINSI
jgi:hypothetical protein